MASRITTVSRRKGIALLYAYTLGPYVAAWVIGGVMVCLYYG